MKNSQNARGWFSLGAAIAIGLAVLATSTGWAAVAKVNVVDFAFSPTNVTIQVQDKVAWTWTGNFHSTTSDTGLWDSGIFFAGASFTNTFNSAGVFPYHCSAHPFMTARVTVQGAVQTNSPPAVSITSPTEGDRFPAPWSGTILANLSDQDGSVVRIDFLADSVLLGSVTNPLSPASFSVSNLAPGDYALTAVATDNGGATTTSSPVHISVVQPATNAPPSVSLTSPSDGAVFVAPWTGVIQAAVSDSDGTVSKVDFFAGTNLLGTVSTPAATVSVTVTNLAAGNYTITAVATDDQGVSTTSSGISINITSPSAITLTSLLSPAEGSFQFTFGATPGLRYLVERSSDLSLWNPLATNTASEASITFTDSAAGAGPNFYRVKLLSN